MATVMFNESDAELLYSFPKPASELGMIVRCFTFINRVAPPTYDEIRSCLSKAQRVGIVRWEGGGFVVEREWYERIHRADGVAENEIESMLDFEEWFLKSQFEEVVEAVVVPAEDEYASIVGRL